MKHLILALALLIPTPPQAVEVVDASDGKYREEVYVTGFGMVCIILTKRGITAPVGLSCDWDQVLANKGKMLRPSRKMPEPLTSDFAKQQMQHAKPVVRESK